MLERLWQPGDLITLDLPLPIEQMSAHPDIQANQGCVAPSPRMGPAMTYDLLREKVVLASKTIARPGEPDTGARPELASRAPFPPTVSPNDPRSPVQHEWQEQRYRGAP